MPPGQAALAFPQGQQPEAHDGHSLPGRVAFEQGIDAFAFYNIFIYFTRLAVNLLPTPFPQTPRPWITSAIVGIFLLVGCGGSGGGGDTSSAIVAGASSTPPWQQPTSVKIIGVFEGTLTSTNPAEAASATAFLYGDSLIPFVHIVSDRNFQYSWAGMTGAFTAYAPAGANLSGGKAWASFTSQSSSLTTSDGTHECSFDGVAGGDTISFRSTTAGTTFDGPLALSDLDGTYRSPSAANSLGADLTMTVAGATGSVTLPDGSSLTVKLGISEAGKSVLSITAQKRVAESGATIQMAGLGTYGTLGSAQPTLRLSATGATQGFAGTFTRNP